MDKNHINISAAAKTAIAQHFKISITAIGHWPNRGYPDKVCQVVERETWGAVTCEQMH
jgi:2'-5' RNA ligase